MISGSSFFSGIQCPFGADCQRPYCQFQHPRAPVNSSTQNSIKEESQQNWVPATTSNINTLSSTSAAVICQEESSDFQGYMGYVGSTGGSIGGTSNKTVTYAQEEPSTFAAPIYGQQIFGGIPNYSSGYSYPTLHTSASVYAPEDPGSFNTIPAPIPTTNYQQQSKQQQQQQQQMHNFNKPKQQNIPPLMSLYPSNNNNLSNIIPNIDYSTTTNMASYEPTTTTNYEPSNSPPASFSPPPNNDGVDKKQQIRANFSPLESATPLGGKKGCKSTLAQRTTPSPSTTTTNTATTASDTPPAYIPTPIAVLERQKKKTETKIGEKRRNSESDEAFSKKNYNIPVDLADDEILNPNKGSLISLKKSKAPIPAKKPKLSGKDGKDGVMKNGNKEVPGSILTRINAAPKAIKTNTKDSTPKILKIEKEVEFNKPETISKFKKKSIDFGDSETKKSDSSSSSMTSSKSNKLDELNRRTKFLAEMDKQIAEKELALKKAKSKTLLAADKKPIWKRPETIKKESSVNGKHFSIDDLFNDDEEFEPKETSVKSTKVAPIASTSFHETETSTNSSATNIPTISSSNSSLKIRPKNAIDQMKNRFENSKSSSPKENSMKEKIFNKGEARAARTANHNTKKLLPMDMYNKTVPYSLRVKLLERIHEEYLKIGMAEESVDKAIEEEKAILDKVSTKSGYMSAMTNLIKQIRNLVGTEKGASCAISHNDMLAGRHSGTFTVGLQRDKKKATLKPDHIGELDFYNELNESYLLDEEQLFDNGYPRWVDPTTKQRAWFKPPDPGSKSIFVEDSNLKRICSRCGAEYRLTIDGDYAVGDNSCTFHWGKAWKKRINGTLDSRYTCCNEDLSVKGCSFWKFHITESRRQSELKNFIETPRPFGVGDPRSRKVYAMDCEMIYTVWGPALARVSVVDLLDELVLDVIVKPDAMIVDCNTRFSGLTPENLENSNCDLNEARERLFELVNSETILIGHSLESDLKAMRIVHKKIVDTSVVFPHRLGPPKKRALKTLSSEILQKIIQEEESGHDSKEDAVACMKLMLHKIREDKS